MTDTNLKDCRDDGYWCVICQRYLPSVAGVVVHDDVKHPEDMVFTRQETAQ